MYDVIVVGARCAGAPTAMLLARKGYRVLLVDRATFPSDVPQGHFIHREGPRLLRRWGLLERVADTCPAVRTIVTDFGDCCLTARELVVDGVAMGYGPRRSRLDDILVRAAADAGVEVREGLTVEGFSFDGDRLTGIRARPRSGASSDERAQLTIGADGRHSRLARAVRAAAYEVVPPLACWYFSYWGDVPGDALEIYLRGRRALFAFPTSDGLFAVFAGWPIDDLPAVRGALEREFLAAVALVPSLAERLRQGRRAERFYGAADMNNFLRVPHGPGWALVGDAGCHKDPYMALGICDALRDVELLVDAVDAGLSGREPLAEALAGYEQRRNAATMGAYRENLALAQFRPLPPEVLALRAALRENPQETTRFFLAREGMITPESFFNPEHLRVLGAAPATAAAQRE